METRQAKPPQYSRLAEIRITIPLGTIALAECPSSEQDLWDVNCLAGRICRGRETETVVVASEENNRVNFHSFFTGLLKRKS